MNPTFFDALVANRITDIDRAALRRRALTPLHAERLAKRVRSQRRRRFGKAP